MKKLFVSLILLISLSVSSVAKGDDAFTWMGTALGNLGGLFGCISVPQFTNFKTGKVVLDLENPGIWQSTGLEVKKDKAIKFSWNTNGVSTEARKYKVLYRIDPRFDQPQIYIKTYNYQTKQYEATDFPAFNSSDIGKDLDQISFPRMQDYVNYTKFLAGRKKIRVEKGDIINLVFINQSEFFNINTLNNILMQDLGPNNSLVPAALYTNQSLNSGTGSNLDQTVLYTTADKVCNVIDPSRTSNCQGSGTDTRYIGNNNMALVGKPFTASVAQDLMNSFKECGVPSDPSSAPACFYSFGRAFEMRIGSKIIKKMGDSSILGISSTPYFYYKSDVGGELDFTTSLPINSMFDQSSSMQDWVKQFPDFSSFSLYFGGASVKWGTKFIHFGNYTMEIEVGNGNETVPEADLNDIQVEYIIMSSGAPSNSTSGNLVNQDFSIDADKDGYLWVRVLNPNSHVKGNISLSYGVYTGSTWFSEIVYTGAVKPITDQFQKFTKDFYTKLTQHAALKNIAKASLTLYVIIFGLMFVMGAVKLTGIEVLIRIFKITLISVLISDDSWRFFNEYLFSAFLNGTDYLMSNITGITSSKANIFGFIDPIFDRYTNGTVWGLLFIQLLQIHNGLTFIAIITIYSMITYFRAILEVIVSYIVAFVGISVMIALAPFFIILMLFEKTKSLFDNWLSTLFNYMIQPTILLIFFLLIDQIISEQLLKVIVEACWGTLIPLKIGLDLSHLGIPLDFSFSLPFLPGIPFFVPKVPEITATNILDNNTSHFLMLFTTALLFYAYCLMARGLVDYTTIVIAQLTNVTPARQEGNFQAPSSPTASIMSDIGSVAKPFKDLAVAPAYIFKDKVIDQNYKARSAGGGNQKDYADRFRSNRNDASTDNTNEQNDE